MPMKHHHHQMIPVWFFIGALLLVYGVIIVTVGIAEFSHPPLSFLPAIISISGEASSSFCSAAFTRFAFGPGADIATSSP